MQQISLVTARVVRENEQYAYKLVGKGEKYLVRHEDGDNAGEAVVEYLSPYAKEPVCIESIQLQKNIEFINVNDTQDHIYKCTAEYITTNEDTGKETKVRRSYYMYAESIREALNIMDDFLVIGDAAVTSIALTKIIEVL